VGLLDQTSFAKYSVSGPGAQAFLSRLCANRLPAVGRIALTQMCRPGGGIECDVTITRTEPERFHVVSAAATELHDYAWLEWHLPDDGSVELHNETERYGVLTLAGPRSRELLQSLVEDDIARRRSFFARSTSRWRVPTWHCGLLRRRARLRQRHHRSSTGECPRRRWGGRRAARAVDFGHRALGRSGSGRLTGAGRSCLATLLEDSRRIVAPGELPGGGAPARGARRFDVVTEGRGRVGSPNARRYAMIAAALVPFNIAGALLDRAGNDVPR
jgi:hypothetical protein